MKNSRQSIASFVHFELRDAPEPCIEGYQSMETRISAIAQLYDLISRAAAFGPVQVGEYLEGIAETLSKSLLGDTPTIHIRVEAEPLRSEEHTSELQSLMRISYAVFCL